MAQFFDHFTTVLRETGILDLGPTGNFLKNGVGIPTGKSSGKIFGMPNGLFERATQQVLLPTMKINKEA